MTVVYTIPQDKLRELKDVVDGKSKTPIVQIFDFVQVVSSLGLGTVDFWNGQQVNQLTGKPFSTTAEAYFARMLAELRPENPLSVDDVGAASRFLTNTAPVPSLGMLFNWANTPQGRQFWGNEAAKAKKGADLSPAAREALTQWTLERGVEALKKYGL